ncbi:MAG: hypothetical protein IJY87_02855 [Bacilli bacterium]|nr:hypothetical protein [Bacilli bacterium]
MRYNKFSKFLVIILIIIECVTLYLMGMSLSSKKTINLLELNSEEILTSDVFAIMLEQEDGTFKESKDAKWPTEGYIYNHELSGCTDKNGNTLNGALTYNDTTKVATLDAKTTVSCFLYFNVIKEPPSDFTFYLGGSSNPEYSVTANTTAYLSWEDEDIISYCITDVNNSNSCTWNEISGLTNTVDHVLNNTQGAQTWYVFIKNKYNLISNPMVDSIIYDSVAPVIGNFYLGGSDGPDYTTSVSTLAYSTWSATDVSKYCISTTNSSENCSWESTIGTSLNESYSLSSTEGSQTRYLFLMDKAGNISSSKSDSIIYDKTAPTITTFYLGGSTNPTYATSTSTTSYITWSATDVANYCVNTTNSSSNCSWKSASGTSTNASYTLSSTQGSQTRYVFLKDKAGNISSSKSDSITLDSTSPSVTTFYLGGSTNPTYTTSTSTTSYITWSATDVANYCVNTSNSSSNCSWKSASGTSANASYTLSSTEGSQTRYVFLKDKAGNVSTSKNDAITLDSISPVVTSASDTTKGTMKASVTENGSGISQVCVNSTSSSTSGCTWESMSAVSFTTTKKVASAGTYYLHVKDKAGNVGHSGAVALTIVPPNLYLICKGMTLSACLSNSDKVAEIQEIANMSDGLSGGMYRYQGKTGTVENNYMCFGTTSTSTCTSNPGRYMYRIIGVNSSGQIRLIKKTSIGDLMWHTAAETSVTWPSSNLKSLINGSTYLTNTTYVPSGWSSKIATYAWKYGNIEHADYTGSSRTPQEAVNGNSYHADNSYAIENAFTSTSSYKVSLMYVTDYFYSHSDTGPGTGTSASTSWLHLLNNEASNSPAEWTMSRKGHNGTYNLVWQITVDDVYPNFNGLVWGAWYGYMCDNGCAVRPTFYLTNTLQITGGNGTITSPYILS